MAWLKFVTVALAVWGTSAFASVPEAVGGERQELQNIQSWMAHLNTYYPASSVEVTEDLGNTVIRQRCLLELQLLEAVLRGETRLPGGSLVVLACNNIVCGGK